MKVFETEHHYIVEGKDYRGKNQFRIHKDLDQIQIEADMDDEFEGESTHIDVDLDYLIAIRDLINNVIKHHENSNKIN